MRNFSGRALAGILILWNSSILGANYYVSTSGNNSNNGSINSPFKTVAKLLSVIQAGDTGYIRTGTYRLAQTTRRSGTKRKPITIQAYKDEKVVLRGTGQKPHGGCFYLRDDWYILAKLDFYLGATGLSIKSGSHNKIINCSSHANYYTGFVISGNGASYNQFLNCDAYDMYDSGGNGGNADGIVVTGQTSTPGKGNSFVGCRSYNNSDDGFDVWKAAYPVKITNCMAFNNGNHKGDGNGFKLGINKTKNDKHILKRCLAWGNRSHGFDYNDTMNSQTLSNCIAYNNKRNYKFWNIRGGPKVHNLQNCISVIAKRPDILLPKIRSQKINSWNFIDCNATAIMKNNFISTDDTIIKGPRNADGTIPDSDFLKLKTGSIFIDKGVNVGLPFNGSAPDFGPFETRGASTSTNRAKKLLSHSSR